MDLTAISQQSIVIFLLISTRISAVLFTAPIYSTRNLSPQIKVWVVVFIALIFTPQIMAVTTVPFDVNPIRILIMLLQEITIGAFMGFVVALIFAIIEFAAFEIDQIAGLQMSMSLNPFSGSQSSMTGQLFYMITVYIFFLIAGHHQLFISIARSFDIVPLGTLAISQATITHLSTMFTNIFMTGMKIALPIYAVLFIINVILGVFARLVPQMNVFFLSFPIKISIGLGLIASFMSAYMVIFPRVLGSIQQDLLIILESIN